MAETPEIPEAKDPFEKRAAATIAILAVILAILGNKAESGRTEAIIKTNEAANKWAYFQAKGIKGSVANAEQEMLASFSLTRSQIPSAESAKDAEVLKENLKGLDEKVKDLKSEVERYKEEQKEPKAEAEKLTAEAAMLMKTTEGCEHGALALQIAIVLASVSILARSHAFWLASIIVGLIGAVVGGIAFFAGH